MLKGASLSEWDTECDKAFQTIKVYLAFPLVLPQPSKGEELFIYPATSIVSMNATFIKMDEDREHKPIYFISKMLIDVESRYIDFE